jgi:SPP1 family predicted phage head-tail adaptor
MIGAGELNCRVTIQASTTSRNSYGEEVLTWVSLGTIWAKRVYKTSREFWSVQKVNEEITDLFIIRHRHGVRPDMRLVHEGRIYNIIGANDPDGTRQELHIICKTGEGVDGRRI